MLNTTDRSSRANIAADLAALAALRAARFARRLMPQLTFLASASAFAHALSAATTAQCATITAASQAKVANARSVRALALRRRSAPLFFFAFALVFALGLIEVSCAPKAKDPKEQASKATSTKSDSISEQTVLTLPASSSARVGGDGYDSLCVFSMCGESSEWFACVVLVSPVRFTGP